MLLWAVARPVRLNEQTRSILLDPANEIHFSAVNVWEVAIKRVRRPDFDVDPARLVAASLQSGFVELPVTAAHALRIATLPLVHGDPFDRMLIAQSLSEPMTLLTNDAVLEQYGPIVMVV